MFKTAPKKKTSVQESKPWAELPIEILSLFMEKLYFTDQIRFRAICKGWNAVHRVPSIDKLPWQLSYFFFENSFSYVDLALKKTYTLQVNAASYEGRLLFGAEFLASKKGWMLFIKYSESLIFLINPFHTTTRPDIIKLPGRKGVTGILECTTFSAIPTSPGCLIFFVYQSLDLASLTIRTCRLADKEWNTCNFVMDDLLIARINDVAYSKRALYCAFDHGVLGIFSVAHNTWRLLSPPMPGTCLSPKMLGLVEFDGELVLVCYPIFAFGDPVLIFSFDSSKEEWVKKESLGNRAIFIDKSSSYAVTVEDGERTKDFADRIYFIDNDKGITSYSLKLHRHLCSQVYPSDFFHDVNFWIDPPN